MPNFDGTGPTGAGPLTGRGAGYCGYGYGMGMGRGMRGRGMGFGMGGFLSFKNQLMVMREHEEMLSNELEALREEIKTLEQETK